MEQQIIVSCLGRPMELGMLYDCRSETPVPGVTLWDFKTLRSNSDMHLRESSKYEITADDSMENKAHFMNVEAEVKLSFLDRLLKVEGAGKYLDNNKSSANQAHKEKYCEENRSEKSDLIAFRRHTENERHKKREKREKKQQDLLKELS